MAHTVVVRGAAAQEIRRLMREAELEDRSSDMGLIDGPTQAEVFAKLEGKALAAAPKGATQAQAISGFLKTDEGKALYHQYLSAPYKKMAEPIRRPPSPTGALERTLLDHIDGEAKQLVERDPGLTMAQATTRVVGEKPNLYTNYLRAKEADRQA